MYHLTEDLYNSIIHDLDCEREEILKQIKPSYNIDKNLDTFLFDIEGDYQKSIMALKKNILLKNAINLYKSSGNGFIAPSPVVKIQDLRNLQKIRLRTYILEQRVL